MDNFGDWLNSGDLNAPEKITTCRGNLSKRGEGRDEDVELVAKSICHILYRALEGGPPSEETQYDLNAAEEIHAWVMASDCSGKLKTRWAISISMALAYLAIKSGGDPSDHLRSILTSESNGAIDLHPQNALNIIKADNLLRIWGGDGRGSPWALGVYKKAVALVDPSSVKDDDSLMREMGLWVEELGASLAIDRLGWGADSQRQRARSKLLQTRSHTERELILRKVKDSESCNLNRIGLASLFEGKCVELGVATGDFSRMIITMGGPSILYCIDKWDDHHDFAEYVKVSERLKGDAVVLRMTFNKAAEQFKDGHFDCIYIDGYANNGQECGETLEEWWPKLRPGGLFAGHDYHSEWPKNVDMVNEFARRHRFAFSVTFEDTGFPSWYGIKAIDTDHH